MPISQFLLQDSPPDLQPQRGLALALPAIGFLHVLLAPVVAGPPEGRPAAAPAAIHSTLGVDPRPDAAGKREQARPRDEQKGENANEGERGEPDWKEVLQPWEGQTLDLVELSTGKRIIRPTLERLITSKGKVVKLLLKEEGQKRAKPIYVKAIVKISAGRQTIFQSAVQGGTAGQRKAQQARAAYAQQIEASQQRMRQRGIEGWPQLPAAAHEAEVQQLRQFVAQVQAAFPALKTTETHEFIVATDIPAQQIGPYVESLDKMHDMLCNLYGIPRGEPLWKGKCLVVAFLGQQDFMAFEARFMQAHLPGVHGVCHQRSDGRVVMACYRGDDRDTFAHMLVHETSHGFNHRWISPVTLPSWLNEGIAEWIGTKIVPDCKEVQLKQKHALAFMKAKGTLGDNFFADGRNDKIEAIQYGMALLLVRFLEERDRQKFAQFVRGIKEGQTVEQSLQAAYGWSRDQLVANFGQRLDIPLRR